MSMINSKEVNFIHLHDSLCQNQQIYFFNGNL